MSVLGRYPLQGTRILVQRGWLPICFMWVAEGFHVMPSRSFQAVCRVHDCVSPSAPETEAAVEGAASPCSEGA